MAVRDAFVPILTLIPGLELDKSSSPLTPISLEWNYGRGAAAVQYSPDIFVFPDQGLELI